MAAPTRDSAGFYSTPYGQFMSVTTVLSHGVPKPALVHWAAVEVARAALDMSPKLVRVRGEDARKRVFDELRHAAERKRDTAADLGRVVHRRIESHVLGRPEGVVTDDEAPFMAAFDKFIRDWQPEWQATELTVCHPEHEWAGTGDGWMVLPSLGTDCVLIDVKTGKNVYAEAGLQLAAYRRATVGWHPDGEQCVPPETTAAYVLHIRPDKYKRNGGYALIPMKTDDAVYDAFLNAQSVARYTTGLSKEVVGKPLPIPKAA